MKPSQIRFAPLSSIVLVGVLSVLAPRTSFASNAHAPAAKKDDHHAAAPLHAVPSDLKPIKRAAQPTTASASKVTSPEDELDQAKKAVAKEHGDDDHAEIEVPVVTQPKIVSGPAPGTEGHAEKADDQDDHGDHAAKASHAGHDDHHAVHSAPAVKKAPASAAGSHGHAPAPATHAAAATHDSANGVTADQSLQWLTNGNTRYLKKHFRADGRTQADRDRLLKGQHPHAIVLSCADSRVAPEIVFDQVQGEIFTVRTAGEALDTSVIASIEYAVEHLSPKLIVVMGHTKCGAVDAAINVKEGDSAGSEALDKLLADIRPRLKTVKTEKPSNNLEIESTVNADGVARDLVERSELIKKKVEAGELKIKPALYRIDTGKVTFY